MIFNQTYKLLLQLQQSRIIMNMRQKLSEAQASRYWKPFMRTIKFVAHFIVVMVMLYCGAVVFATIEDSDAGSEMNNTAWSNRQNVQQLDKHDYDKLWMIMEEKYNFTFPPNFQHQLWKSMIKYTYEKREEVPSHLNGRTGRRDREILGDVGKYDVKNGARARSDEHFIFMKWFYFVTVATTTIGYGHVYPVTDNGKLFYMIFSIIGIVTMMTLLRSCGQILMTVNKNFYTLVCKWFCKQREYVSDQLMSIVSLTFIFLVFMVLVVYHDKHINELKHWSWIDTFYFWLVTFTTVGFGDVHFPLRIEVEHFYELVLCRVFGLSFLAGIIESIYEYIQYRKRKLIVGGSKRLQMISQIIIGNATPVALAVTHLPTHTSKTSKRRKSENNNR